MNCIYRALNLSDQGLSASMNPPVFLFQMLLLDIAFLQLIRNDSIHSWKQCYIIFILGIRNYFKLYFFKYCTVCIKGRQTQIHKSGNNDKCQGHCQVIVRADKMRSHQTTRSAQIWAPTLTLYFSSPTLYNKNHLPSTTKLWNLIYLAGRFSAIKCISFEEVYHSTHRGRVAWYYQTFLTESSGGAEAFFTFF